VRDGVYVSLLSAELRSSRAELFFIEDKNKKPSYEILALSCTHDKETEALSLVNDGYIYTFNGNKGYPSRLVMRHHSLTAICGVSLN
jgi:hypothetical protein